MSGGELCSQCGGNTLVTPEGERVCETCGCAVEILVVGMAELDTHEEVDLHSLDGGLGTDSLQTVKDVRFNSLLLKNTWQCVLGYLKLGKRDLFVERRLEDLIVALDGASDEQFLACRNLMLKEIRSLANRGFGPARRETRKAVLGRTLEAARQTWPRLASRLEGRDWAGDQG